MAKASTKTAKNLGNLESALAVTAQGAWTAPAAPEQDGPGPAPVRKAKGAATREGTANISAHLPKRYQFDLKDLANAQTRQRGHIVPVQDLIAEALDDLFRKYGHPTSD